MPRRFTLVTALVLVACASWCGPAWAHPAIEAAAQAPAPAVAAPTATWSSAPTPPAVPWPAILAAAAALIVAWRRPRRARALAIVLILALFAFENGVHSVHHLNDLRHLDDLRSGLTSRRGRVAHLSVRPSTRRRPSPSFCLVRRLVVQFSRPSTRCPLGPSGRAPPISA